MKLIGYMSLDGAIHILTEFKEQGAKFQKLRPGMTLEVSDTLPGFPEGTYAILHKQGKDSVVIYPYYCKPKGWTWQQLVEVADNASLLVCDNPNQIKEVFI